MFLDKITLETLHDFHILYWWHQAASYMNLMSCSSSELQDPTILLAERAEAYGMEVSIAKSKLMVNSTNDTNADISKNGHKQEEVTNFTVLGGDPV